MISVAQGQALIRERTALLPSASATLDQAHGRVLREPVAAAEDFPPFDRSAMDGYAVRADDAVNEFEVIGEIRAGEKVDADLQPGQAMRIFTGARLPGPGLKVVMQEDVEARPPHIRLSRPSALSHVRHRGEDARAGEVLLEAGACLDATAISLLASMGKVEIQVTRPPRVLHVTTGDEIVPPGQPLLSGQIPNSNGPLISALCREFGAGEVTHLHAPDQLETMIALVEKAVPKDYDLILVSGGSGAGKYDFTSELFRRLNVEIHFKHVDVRPGKPLIFGTAVSQLVFGLPGNALSHFVCFHLFIRPALDRLLGKPSPQPASALLTESVVDTLNSRETWWPVRTIVAGAKIEAIALPWKSSGDITRLPGADALIRVPANTPELPAGTRVGYLSTRSPF
jgi:molybdopterin molybdotransferase